MTLAPAPTRHDRCWNITDVRDCGEIQALAVGGAVMRAPLYSAFHLWFSIETH